MTNIRNALMQAAGTAASGDPVYVEDVFSTFLYTGNGSNGLAIDNGIDLAGEGGLVWMKGRTSGGVGSDNHCLATTEQGLTNQLCSDLNNGNISFGQMQSFDNDGFTLTNGGTANTNAVDYVSWTFRKQKGFFDVVKFSTTGGGGTQAVSHSLGSIPGVIMIKKTSASQSWLVFHKSVTSPNSNWWRNFSGLDDISAAFDDYGNDTAINSAPTATTVTLGSHFTGGTADYVMYFFAEGGSDDQIFGDDGDEAIIKTGIVTTNAAGVIATDVDLGFEPQWLLLRRTNNAHSSWNILDTMRGFHGEKIGNNKYVRPNNSNAEANNASADGEFVTTNGFGGNGNGLTGGANSPYAYVAIRRGPMKEPEAGTDVFIPVDSDSNGAFQTGFPVDCYINVKTDGAYSNYWSFRKMFSWTLATEVTDASQGYDASGLEKGWGSSTYYSVYDEMAKVGKSHTGNYTAFCWRRYPKVFDIVQYEGAGAGTHTHSLKAVPEMILLSCISHPNRNVVYHKAMGNTKQLHLDEDIAETTGQFGDTTPTASVFTVSDNTQTGTSGRRFIAMLFASLDGICEVGSYTGTGNDLNITGLGAAVRWVMIKRTDATGDWYVYDTTRGIVAGNDPYARLNLNAADVTNTDYIDPHSSGFTITSSAPNGLNASGGTYIYLAYA